MVQDRRLLPRRGTGARFRGGLEGTAGAGDDRVTRPGTVVTGLPFDRPGRFWKGNLHTHSDRSDGALSPEKTVRHYRDSGYDFLALTDHFRAECGFPVTDTRPLRTAGFTTLLGA